MCSRQMLEHMAPTQEPVVETNPAAAGAAAVTAAPAAPTAAAAVSPAAVAAAADAGAAASAAAAAHSFPHLRFLRPFFFFLPRYPTRTVPDPKLPPPDAIDVLTCPLEE